METPLNQNTPYDSSVQADNDPVFQYISNLKSNTNESALSGKFDPIGSGNFDRNLNRTKTRDAQSSSVDQVMGIARGQDVNNANNYIYARTIEFPQPSIAGIGSITSAGAADSTRYFFPQGWTITKLGGGQYQINHQMGDGKYNVVITPINTAGFTACLSNFAATSFRINTFNAAGAAADCAFTFIVYIIP
jgi:hypothetical protein